MTRIDLVAATLVAVVAVTIIGAPARATDPPEGWTLVSDTDELTVSVKDYDERKTQGGEAVSVMRGQMLDKSNGKNNVTFYQWYVTHADCRSGMGKLVSADTRGEFKFDTDFIAGGQSVASMIADYICSVHRYSESIKRGSSI